MGSSRQREDPGDNFLILDLTIFGKRFTLAAVYGPNNNDLEFFDTLEQKIHEIGNGIVILGGDWNATWDPSPVNDNIDVINMQNIPSKRRSEQINAMARRLSLMDPFRFLYPHRKEFTFVPNIVANRNRSRIDFFLVSTNIINQCKSVVIPHNLSSKTFDHKPVEVNFKKIQIKNLQAIKDTIIKDPLLQFVIKVNTFDCYNNHSLITETHTLRIKEMISRKLGIILSEIANIQNLKLSISQGTIPVPEINLALNRIELMTTRISNVFADLPSLDFFESLPLSCEPDTFFETLAIHLKNEALSFQAHFYQNKNAKKKNLRERIQALKQEYNINKDQIFNLECQLSTIIDLELKDELALVKNFERLNDEKITPYFLQLAKKPDSGESLNNLKDENNLYFESDKLREEHIISFYRDLYKSPVQAQTNNTALESFLEDVTHHPEVESSKLNDEEKNFLDRPLTIGELDNLVKKCKINSSPGIDGISNRFIKEFWEFFRVPLFNYANTCYAKGELTLNFRSAKIRLIPKKGDCSQLKNWRPISLLNCFYKIVSRAIAERLKSVINKITHVGQKGYNSQKQCQEVLISMLDEIQTARINKSKGALLSLDIRKAFDTISHNFINQAFRFFNFGENFIKWLNLIGTNRRACIILENGKVL